MKLNMFKVILNKNTIKKLQSYSKNYRNYFEEIYSDTWIWNEDTIIESYLKESIFRYEEIKTKIISRLSDSIITRKNNQAIIRWRSKILIISFQDSWDTRTITDLEIR